MVSSIKNTLGLPPLCLKKLYVILYFPAIKPQSLKSLPGFNLTKSDLSGADLSNTNLSQVRLSEANLTNADLTNADFTDMNFFKFEFFGTDLSGADLTGADLTGADLEWGFFYGLNLSDTVLECFNNSICK